MKTINEFLEDFNIDLDLQSAYTDGMDFNEFRENIETQINQTEVIYYSNAIDYLKENDPSLNESLSIASDLGYTFDNLTSETLATILKQQNLHIEFNEIADEIEEYFEEYVEY